MKLRVSVFCQIILSFTLFWGKGSLLFAQPSEIQFKHIGINEGLSHNHITSILKASDGFLWIGTPAGLNRYDGHSVKVYKNQSGNYGSLKDNSVVDIFEGPEGNLWVSTGQSMNVLDIRKDRFISNTDSLQAIFGVPAGLITDLQRDKKGNYWFLHKEQGLFQYNPNDKRNTRYKSKNKGRATAMSLGAKNNVWLIFENGGLESLSETTLETRVVRKLDIEVSGAEFKIFADNRDSPWIFTKNMPMGVFWWKDLSQQPVLFSTKSGIGRLNNNTIMGIAQDLNGRVWIATDHGGINLYNPETQSISYLIHQDFNERSLIHNGTSTLICDREGMVWVATYKGGLSYYHEGLIQFPVYKNHRGGSSSLPCDDVNRIIEDKNENLWIGTNGGGLIFYDKKQNLYKQYLHNPADKTSLGSDVIVSLLLDKNDNLWVGTYHGGLNLFKNGRFTRFVHDPANAKSLSNNSVWELYQDRKGRIWVGTLSGGVSILVPETGEFIKSNGKKAWPTSTYICSMLEDNAGNMWFGTATGIQILDANQTQITYYKYNREGKGSLSNDYISDMLQDSKGRVWIATHEGLNLFNPKSKSFTVFKEENGLRDNTINTILEDNTGKIWISTSKGVSVIADGKSDTRIIRNFDQHDGLQSVAFNENAAVKLKSGDLLFGGPLGFNRINPAEITHEDLKPRPVIVDFLLFNKSVKAGEAINGKKILSEVIQYTEEIVLKHDQNVFSLSISPLYYLHPERVKVRYILEGFSKEWLDLDSKSRLATFTNLNAGEYVFKAIFSIDDELWSEPVTLLKIRIKPPFWFSGWAYAFYILTVFGLLYIVRFLEQKRQQSRFVLQQEREEARRIKELDQLKTKFFTNVSHEFRTPVSLIISPIEKLVNLEIDDSKKSHLKLVHRNARRLLNLVNQLLDFRKIDTQSLQVYNTEGDVMAQILDDASSFQDMAESKEIDYQIHISQQKAQYFFDHDKLERIVFNLLSNAFKFTPVGGKVSITSEVENNTLKITVEDTGIGISEEAKTKIFDRYYQDDILKPLLNQGSGIGLAITKEYVHLLGGALELKSILEKGSSFMVSIPLSKNFEEEPAGFAKQATKGNLGGNRILVVEDNDDFRFYLVDNLKEAYHVEEARNYTEGWEKALSFHPDIIVSDVNMPGNTGIELCKKLKSDNRTLHIPVILLTALTAQNHQLAGIEAGAADYIVKPFNVELLLSKIRSHIKQKDSFEKTFKKQFTIEPTEIQPESADEKFIKKALEVVEQNVGNPLFSVEVLAEKMNVSRVGLYKRILTLSGLSPSEFIRNIRLKRATRLPEDTRMTVAEVAYEVGFNNPKVFSKYFKDVFGKIPSEYRKEHS